MMNTLNETNPSQPGQHFANKVADKAIGGIDKVASTLTDTVESARQRSKQIVDQVDAAATKVRDSAAQASDSLITYTKNNPVKALMMAAGAGALFLAVIKAFTPSRD
jgi:ElaB/YqjD/DUF883 family membrane-anchored ribosome-binding protein